MVAAKLAIDMDVIHALGTVDHQQQLSTSSHSSRDHPHRITAGAMQIIIRPASPEVSGSDASRH